MPAIAANDSSKRFAPSSTAKTLMNGMNKTTLKNKFDRLKRYAKNNEKQK